MNSATLHLTLLGDVVLSERAASSGGHSSLDYIPGANLLGAAAAALYAQLPQADQFTVFHSGKFRFGNALPAAHDNTPMYPMPLCWHTRKSDLNSAAQGELAAPRNFQLGEFEDNAQPKQLRGGYVHPSGTHRNPEKELRMKTAIDARTGTASDAQLFGYESIGRGEQFIAQITADNDVDSKLFDSVVAALCGHLRLGRSRSAEYGRAKVEKIASKNTWDVRPQAASNSQEVTLWLLSDLAAQDAHGQPVLCPIDATWLGLPAGNLDLAKSFIRSRSYTPFNGHYRRRELERAVLQQGSVLHFKFDQALTEAEFQLIGRGLGLYRQAGLGQVWVNPPLLATATPPFGALRSVREAQSEVTKPDGPLIHWLEKQLGRAVNDQAETGIAKAWIDDLGDRYKVARSLNGIAKPLPIGPSASQWGSVATLAREAKDRTDLREKLFEKKNGYCVSEAWQLATFVEGERSTLVAWLDQHFAKIDEKLSARDVVAIFAGKARDFIAKEAKQKGDNQ